jgi:hypothetical protein
VHHDARVGQGEALAAGTARQQLGAHAGRLANTDRAYVAANELHGVVYGQA